MIHDRVKAALQQEGSAAFVTHGPGGAHLVATVNSPHHAAVRQRFPWARAAVVLHVSQVEQVLGK